MTQPNSLIIWLYIGQVTYKKGLQKRLKNLVSLDWSWRIDIKWFLFCSQHFCIVTPDKWLYCVPLVGLSHLSSKELLLMTARGCFQRNGGKVLLFFFFSLLTTGYLGDKTCLVSLLDDFSVPNK